MTIRTVEVELRLKTAQYAAEADRMADKTDKIDRAVDKTDRDLKKLPPDAAKAAAAMKLLGDDAGRASLRLQDLGKSSTSMGTLDQRIIHTRGELHRLAEEFDRTGNVSVLQRIFATGDELKALEKFKSELTSAMGDAGQQGGQSFFKSFAATFSGAGQYIIPGLIAAGIVTSPLIGGAINGALLTGIGLGGIALGIVGQIRDPAVRAALTAFGHDILTTLGTATEPFRGPLLTAIATVSNAVRSMLTGIDFKGLATTVAPLAAGIAGLIREAGPGASKALATAIRLLNTFAAELPNLGRGLSIFFDQISHGGEGAAEGLRTLIALIVGTLAVTGALIRVLSDVYAAFILWGDAVTDTARQVLAFVPGLGFLGEKLHEIFDQIAFGNGSVQTFGRRIDDAGSAAAVSADDFSRLAAQINQTRNTLDTLAGAVADKWLDSMLAGAHATLSFEESLTRATESIKTNGKTLDIHTAKGQANQEAIYAMVEANKQVFDQMIAGGATMDEATARWAENTRRIYEWGKANGISKGQLDGLIGSMKNVPPQVNSTIAMQGLSDALDRLAELLRRLNGLTGERIVRVKTIFTKVGEAPPHYALGGIRRAATGMIVGPSNPGTLIGEPQTGGEALIPLRGISQGSAATLMRTAGAGYGLDVVPRGRGYSGGGTTVIVRQPINVTTPAGDVIHRTMIEFALNTGRSPADLWSESRR